MKAIRQSMVVRCCVLALLVVGMDVQAADDSGLYPPPEAFKSGHLEVGDGHEIYYACFGNPEGTPVMCLHGGPGVGSYPRLAQYFNPSKFLIVLHDQRGTGKSVPQGELTDNTTQHLVADIEKLRRHLELGKVLVFGGSWGSTLALLYAESFPEQVSGMILRGVFLGTSEEIEYHYNGNRFFFPQEYDALLAVLPTKEYGVDPDYLFQLITGEDQELAARVKRALALYEMKFMKLYIPDEVVTAFVDKVVTAGDSAAQLIDLSYVSHRYYLEDNQILDNISQISDIPAIIINGRYDMAAPPFSAFRVHKALKRSKLVIVEKAGHSESEEGITAELLAACASFE